MLTVVQLVWVTPLNLNGNMQGLLGVGPPIVMQEEPDCLGVSVSQEENLSVMLQSPHLQTNYLRSKNSYNMSQCIIRKTYLTC